MIVPSGIAALIRGSLPFNRDVYRPGDFVVLKVDIDNTAATLELMRQVRLPDNLQCCHIFKISCLRCLVLQCPWPLPGPRTFPIWPLHPCCLPFAMMRISGNRHAVLEQCLSGRSPMTVRFWR